MWEVMRSWTKSLTGIKKNTTRKYLKEVGLVRHVKGGRVQRWLQDFWLLVIWWKKGNGIHQDRAYRISMMILLLDMLSLRCLFRLSVSYWKHSSGTWDRPVGDVVGGGRHVNAWMSKRTIWGSLLCVGSSWNQGCEPKCSKLRWG